MRKSYIWRIMKRAIVWFRRDLRIADNTAFLRGNSRSRRDYPSFSYLTIIFSKIFRQMICVCLSHKCFGDASYRSTIHWWKSVCVSRKPEELIPKLPKSVPQKVFWVVRWVATGKSEMQEFKILSEKGGFLFGIARYVFVDEALLPPRKVFSAFGESGKRFRKIPPISVLNFVKHRLFSFLLARYCRNACSQRTSLWNSRRLHIFLMIFLWNTIPKPEIFPALEDGTSRLRRFFDLASFLFGRYGMRFNNTNMLPNRKEAFAKELCWREFGFHIAQHFPESLEQVSEKKDGILLGRKMTNCWMRGKLETPVIRFGCGNASTSTWRMDARTSAWWFRLFSRKIFLLDWREGERHFANLLFDYEEAVNVEIGSGALPGADPSQCVFLTPCCNRNDLTQKWCIFGAIFQNWWMFPWNTFIIPFSMLLPASPIVFHAEQVVKAKRMYGQRAKRWKRNNSILCG